MEPEERKIALIGLVSLALLGLLLVGILAGIGILDPAVMTLLTGVVTGSMGAIAGIIKS